ncbi:UNKNOWN [Stylonychia lemnae]|uniref:Uncharacterized protein n=1 Tax=Stylonychia lemnae TaxID=5949 RepID=A0A078AYY3_STYLE|nr:UNKNOWN [Stylonychia lemnae]|eukprot:CDW87341.1 UNKNOWN [Stylonychia lemnae]
MENIENQDSELQFQQELQKIDVPSLSEFEQGRFQLMNLTKQYDLSSYVYPICISDCVKDNRNDKRVFSTEELRCANNCISKYRLSLQTLTSFVTQNLGNQ